MSRLQRFGPANVRRRLGVRQHDLRWLDELAPLEVLAPQEQGFAYAPDLGTGSGSTDVTLPPVALHRFRDVVVSASSSAFLTKQGLVVERPLGEDRSRYSLTGGMVLAHTETTARAFSRPARSAIVRGIFLGGFGYFNYYHWLMEILPKLQFLDQRCGRLSGYPLLVGESVRRSPGLREALEVWRDGREIIYLDDLREYLVEDCVHVTSPSGLPFNLTSGQRMRVADVQLRPSIVAGWRARVLGHEGKRVGSTQHIFLGRSGARRQYNQEEVFANLAPYGLRDVRLEELSLGEQARVMADASLIVGPTGAAWTNLMFASPGAKGLCWMAESYREFACYSTLARFCGVELRYELYATPAGSTADLHGAPYSIDAAVIARRVAALVTP